MFRSCWIAIIAVSLGFFVSGCGSDQTDAPQAAGNQPPVTGAVVPHTAQVPQDDQHPIVVLRTSLGELTLKLNAKQAPITVQNFLNYVEGGHYDGTIFHQVEPGYVALGGGYVKGLLEKPGRYPIRNEADNGLKNRRGTIAMARQIDEVDSSTCQFFLNLTDNPNLDHKGDAPEKYGFCVFGEVIDGLDVLDQLAKVPVHDVDNFTNVPVETVMVEMARRTR